MRIWGALAFTSVMLAAAAPAKASTVPDLPSTVVAGTIQASLFNLSYDYRLTDRLAVGATTVLNPFDYSVAIRTTLTQAEFSGGSAFGWTFSLGGSQITGFGFRGPIGATPPADKAVWFQPAMTTRTAILPWMRVRAYVAPSIRWGEAGNGEILTLWRTPLGGERLSLGAVAAAEVAFSIGESHEVTLGGGSILGWRGRY